MQSIQAAVTQERQKLLALLEESVRLAEAGDEAGAHARFCAFAGRLRAHQLIEEEILFPVVERALGGKLDGTTASLRREHGVLRDLVAHVEDSLQKGRSVGLVPDLLELTAALRLHAMHEERVVDTVAERELRPEALGELQALVDALR